MGKEFVCEQDRERVGKEFVCEQDRERVELCRVFWEFWVFCVLGNSVLA